MRMKSSTRSIGFLISTALLLTVFGCAPFVPSVPLQPLEKGEIYGSIHVTFPFNNFSRANLQWSMYRGISEHDMLGFTFSNVVVLSSLNYAHRFSRDEYNEFVHAYLGILALSPHLEIDYVASKEYEETTQALRVGVGAHMWLFPFEVDRVRIIPVVEYAVAYRDARLSIGTQIGMTKAVIKNLYPEGESMRLEHSADEIDTILVDSSKGRKGYGILLRDGRMLNIREWDPFPDCMGCWIRTKMQNAYPPSEMHRAYWVYYSSGEDNEHIHLPMILFQLNMMEILEEVKRNNRLIVAEDDDAAERALHSFNPWIEDLYIDIGYTDYSKE